MTVPGDSTLLKFAAVFRLFRRPPRLTLPAPQRAFAERTYAWLIENFGLARLMETPHLQPTQAQFPYSDLHDPQQLEALVQQLCTHIHLQRAQINVEVFDDTAYRNWQGSDEEPLGTYQEYSSGERYLVRLSRSSFGHKPTLIVVLAHELMHAHLLGKGYLDHSDPWHEMKNDLALVFFGFGMLQANAGVVVNELKAGNVGYLTPELLGYALALNCWLAGKDAQLVEHHVSRGSHLGFFREALNYLEKGGETALDKKRLQQSGSQEQLQRRIYAQRNSRDLHARKALFDELIKTHPENAEGWKGRGYCFLRMDEFQQALSDLERALRLAPRDAETLSRRAHCLLRLGRTDAAKKDLDAALQFDPKNSLPWRNLGLWHFERKEYNEAYGMLVKAQQLQARTELIHYYLGLVHLERGSKLSAEWEFEQSKKAQETILETYPEL